ncbi:PREDICTED: gibberellin 2-beta-dioxygenase 8-like [Fragaria vesca subsp. vesca]|uniref:gibberellin 2-beta-dioxygenase 8-like n=1 Tax=Fragaria vesca subsp. vesca TaxID=101020 RepID=UPI0002C318CB|nr:PREDICTED: gibberellin 2-beta-dioxygenase 8-like [Fragaria vesca subsp. vesca]
MLVDSNPPLLHNYGALLHKPSNKTPQLHENHVTEECQLPLIDLDGLNSLDMIHRLECARAICSASSEWGFFQVVNHGISPQLIEKMRREQVKLFSAPFDKKQNAGLLNNSYRFGTPTATHASQYSWSEAFHIPVSKISDKSCYGDEFTSLREVMEEFSAAMSNLSKVLAEVLINDLSNQEEALEDICESSSCFLRLNRYPACPFSPEMIGLVPHTDSDFLTILCQDQVGGLQLMKDSKWVAVKPNPDALIVNIGDLFQAWSNDVYKSVEHKVLANEKTERYSIAYFLCPSYDSLIGSSSTESSIYRKFTFGEYRSQIQEDVKKLGHKVGLSRFLI